MIATVDTKVIGETALTSEKKQSHTDTLNQYQTAKQSLEAALTNGNTKARIEAIKSMKQANSLLDNSRRDLIGENIRNTLSGGNTNSDQKNQLETLEATLSNEKLALDKLETLYTQIGTNVDQISGLNTKVKNEPSDNFDRDAQATLSYLRSI